MSNLENFNNIYANLAESAYNNRPQSFPFSGLTKDQKATLNSNKSIFYSYTKDTKDEIDKNKNGEPIYQTTKGGMNLPEGLDVDGNKKEGIVYLQPDPTLKITDKTITTQVPKINGGYEIQTYITGERQKGLLTDSDAGFNAYFVTDTPKLNKDTKKLIWPYVAVMR